MCGIEVLVGIKIFVVEIEGVGIKFLLFVEKLSLVFVCYKVKIVVEGIECVVEVVVFGGMGYFFVIYLNNEEVISKFVDCL